jgi:hypothetical protein
MTTQNDAPVVHPSPSPVGGDEQPKPKDVVAYETHQKLLSEKKKLQERLDALETERKQREETELTQKGEIQKLLDLRTKEAEELRKSLTLKEERELRAKKLGAVLKGLGGSVDDKWFTVIGDHIDDVILNESGEIEQMSVTGVVEGLKKVWPEMIKKSGPIMPNESPNGGTTTIARSEWLKLPSAEMSKWRPEQII